MKKYILRIGLSLFLFSILSTVRAQVWKPVGPDDDVVSFNSKPDFTNMVIDSAGIPYVVYADAAYGNKATVIKFISNKWEVVGTLGFSAGEASDIKLVFNDNTPYVSYADLGNNRKITVMKFDGTNWVPVGTPGFSTGAAFYCSLAFYDSKPYVAYDDQANNSKATVMKFDGINWVLVGAAGFSANATSYLSLAFNGSTPYVTYGNDKATVMKFDGSNWVNVGPAGFSQGITFENTLVFNGSIPYVAYVDGAYGTLKIKRFNGADWLDVGSFTDHNQFFKSFNIIDGIPYVVHAIDASPVAPVLKFDGTNWVPVFTDMLASNTVSFTSIAFNKNVPYILYSSSGTTDIRTTISKLENGSWINLDKSVSDGATYNSAFAISDDTLYVAYCPRRFNGEPAKLNVKKFDGTNWISVGAPDFTTDNVNDISLIFDGNTPYVKYRGVNSTRLTVMKYNGSSWINVGAADFTEDYTSYNSFALDGHTPYIAYTASNGSGVSGKLTVKKFDGGNWINVGTANFSDGAADGISLVVNSGTPYVSYNDPAAPTKTAVKKFDGASWVNVGTPGYSGYLAFNNNVLYMAYTKTYTPQYGSPTNSGMVMKFDGTNWVLLGSDAGASVYQDLYTYFTSFIFNNDIPYATYVERGKTMIKKFDGNNWVPVGTNGLPVFSPSNTALAAASNGKLYYEYILNALYVKVLDQDSTLYSNARLNSVSVSSGTLSPAFDVNTYSYMDSVPNTVERVTIIPITSDSKATVKINGKSVSNGTASLPVLLTEGNNTISVVVAAQDSITKKTYTITVIQGPPKTIISDVSPSTVTPGATVTITGINIDRISAVSFGGTAATSFVYLTTGGITAVVGAGSSGDVSVTTPLGTGTFPGFHFVPLPTVSASGLTTFITGDSVVLTASPGSGFDYQWLKDGTSISGATGASYSAKEGGSYTVKITLNAVSQESAATVVTSVFSLPASNFTITNTGVTCKGSVNGSISISAVKHLSYMATITGNGLNAAHTFTDSVKVDDLAPGSYNVCITVAGQSAYQQCFTTMITEPKDISLFTAVNKPNNEVVLTMGGGTAYNVNLNGALYTTSNSQLTLPLKKGTNSIKVYTNKVCQGIIEKTIILSDDILVYPNPFENSISLSMGKENVQSVIINVYAATSGKKVYTGKYNNQPGLLKVDLSSLSNGIYLLNLTADNIESVFKIVKK